MTAPARRVVIQAANAHLLARVRVLRCPRCGKEQHTLAANAWCNDHPRQVAMTESNPLPLTSQEPTA